MITFFMAMVFIYLMFSFGWEMIKILFKVTFWCFILFPLGLTFAMLGLMCCVTFILIPVGMALFGVAKSIMFPGIVV